MTSRRYWETLPGAVLLWLAAISTALFVGWQRYPGLWAPPSTMDPREALVYAIESGDVAAVRAWLNEGISVNGKVTDDSHYTILCLAAEAGQTEVVRLLLDRGADPNRTCMRGFPLDLAVKWGHLETVRLLVDRGARVNDPTWGQPHSPALWLAVSNGDREMVSYLLGQGAKPDILTVDLAQERNAPDIFRLVQERWATKQGNRW